MKTTHNHKTDSVKYQEILDAAAKIFKKKGYYHANISDIASQVAMQKGSLYHYIKSKEDLLYHIFLSSMEHYMKVFDQIIVSDQPSDLKLQEAIIAHMDPGDKQFNRFYVGIHEFQSLTGENRQIARNYLIKYQNMWLDILEKGKQEGIFSKNLDSKVSLLAIFGMCNWSLRWFQFEGKYSRKDLGEMFCKRILNGIKA